MTRVLSLDISTTTIGLAVLDLGEEIKLVHHEHFKPSKKGTTFCRLSGAKTFILDRLRKYKPDEVAIEEFAMFMGGASSAKTIIPLAIINRTIGLAVTEETGKEPFMYNVNSIRAKIKQGKTRLQKENVPDAVAKILGIKYPWIMKINRKTKKEGIAVESYDEADAMAVGIYHLMVRSMSS